MRFRPFEELFEIPLRNGLTKPKRVRGEGFKMVNMGELFAFPRINNAPMDRVPLNDKEKESSMLEDGDLLFARQSLVREGAGQCSIFVTDDEEVCFESHIIRCRLNQEIANPFFYYYFFRSFQGKQVIDAIIEQGAGASGIRGSDLAKLKIPYIKKEIQDEIASQLKAIDDKIELNRQINQTLEHIAQAIFKSWFVDFEPVKAKIKAKQNGHDPERAAMRAISGKTDEELDALSKEHDAHGSASVAGGRTPGATWQQLTTTAALFPDELEDDAQGGASAAGGRTLGAASELGEIPKGWSIESFSKLASLDTTSIKPFDEPEKGWEHYSIPAFDENESPAIERGDEIKSNKYKVQDSAVLASKLNPHFPRTWWPDVEDSEAAICSTEFMQFVPVDETHRGFVYGAILSKPFQDGIAQRVTGTTGSRQRAQPKSVAEIPVVIPTEDLIVLYSKICSELIENKTKNIKQNKSLSAIRDVLLPKFLSGEITSGNTQSTAEAVA